jgi:tight adherence protein B
MAQGTIIVMVPFVLLIVFWALDPNYIAPLFNTTLGLIAVVIMLVLQVIGGIAMHKIIKIEV